MGFLATVAALGAIVGPYIPGITIVTAPAMTLWGPIAAVAGIVATFTGGLGLWINDKIERQAEIERVERDVFRRNVIVGVIFIFVVIAVILFIWRRRRGAGGFRLRIPFIRR
ncbi:hypothetical protein HOLleu_25026 [Holothuria leucospilota]|uniref:Uncharacterized protein n=1 Tax=Holothuria leucospilota TaxID=206669 RepID=A0A9Q1BS99_HOLLE|nr:hypothetical protein HOLleu_25026 [Holothuria leucospilota]